MTKQNQQTYGETEVQRGRGGLFLVTDFVNSSKRRSQEGGTPSRAGGNFHSPINPPLPTLTEVTPPSPVLSLDSYTGISEPILYSTDLWRRLSPPESSLGVVTVSYSSLHFWYLAYRDFSINVWGRLGRSEGGKVG